MLQVKGESQCARCKGTGAELPAVTRVIYLLYFPIMHHVQVNVVQYGVIEFKNGVFYLCPVHDMKTEPVRGGGISKIYIFTVNGMTYLFTAAYILYCDN